MQFPESWLRSFCNPPISTNELADILTMAGMEVEELRPVAPPFSKVVVGEIKSIEQHPNADRLRICQIDVGQADLLNIVCGASNARQGIKIPCAMVGAELPPGADGKPFVIKSGQLRGVESQGMLCSAKELKISEESAGLLELDLQAEVGQSIREHLSLDDTLFTLKLTPNLAHCLSVFGIAREVSALTGAPLLKHQFKSVQPQIEDKLHVVIKAPDLCGRFSGRIVKNINPQAQAPAWMVERLARCGQRSVNGLVDISNYVMFEYGRPSHIFDRDKIHGDLEVRWGRNGEQLELLNAQIVHLDEKVGVIADAHQVESLAGIMGGQSTAVTDDTKNIYIEAAFWWPQAVAGRSRRFNFATDAGHRFERGVDPGLTVEHIEYITDLVLSVCGTSQTQVGPIDDQIVNLPELTPVTLRVARANKIIGTNLTQKEMVNALHALDLPLQESPGLITVTPPSYRFDLKIEEDLIEEVARMVGFEKLPNTPPQAPITPKILAENKRNDFQLRRQLAALGYQETINFSFVEAKWEHTLAGNAKPIELLNPIASQMSVMRSSLIGSLLQVAKFNLDRKASRVRVFEIGRVFLRDEQIQDSLQSVAGIHQPMRVAGLTLGPSNTLGWNTSRTNVDFFDMKADVSALLNGHELTFVASEHPALHPGRCARIESGGRAIGWMGELHPKWRQQWDFSNSPMVFELDLEDVLMHPVPQAKPISKLQAVERDLAVVVDESTTHQSLMACIWSAPVSGLLQDAVLFDVYRPNQSGGTISLGEKSLAVRIVLQSTDDQTLTEAQIEHAMTSIIHQLKTQLNANLRS